LEDNALLKVLSGCLACALVVAVAPMKMRAGDVTLLRSAISGAGSSWPLAVKLPAQPEKVLHAFLGGRDGENPIAGLLADKHGALYGTTLNGGSGSGSGAAGSASGYGTVFKLTPSTSGYTESIIYRFLGGFDGQHPYGSLIDDGSGALYGTTRGTQDLPGTVFKLVPSERGYAETVLHEFAGSPSDGQGPLAGLALDSTGALYGTTLTGGTANVGTVFKISTTGTGYRILYNFKAASDGAGPGYGSLLVDRMGALYGTTIAGGGSCYCGVVYKLTRAGSDYTERLLYHFQDATTGETPYGGLVADPSGNLYGTTALGGIENNGVVFRLTLGNAAYTESVLHRFTGGRDGASPYAGLLETKGGELFGETISGGTAYNAGTVFKISPSGVESVIWGFRISGGGIPFGGLITNGRDLFGTTYFGRTGRYGMVFRVAR
jgi:uncharacterized repeat protein (TIGR03803 family)